MPFEGSGTWIRVAGVSRSQHAFRVAGVGDCASWRLRGTRFFLVTGAGNRTHQVKWLEFLALCDNSAVCVRE